MLLFLGNVIINENINLILLFLLMVAPADANFFSVDLKR